MKHGGKVCEECDHHIGLNDVENVREAEYSDPSPDAYLYICECGEKVASHEKVDRIDCEETEGRIQAEIPCWSEKTIQDTFRLHISTIEEEIERIQSGEYEIGPFDNLETAVIHHEMQTGTLKAVLSDFTNRDGEG